MHTNNRRRAWGYLLFFGALTLYAVMPFQSIFIGEWGFVIYFGVTTLIMLLGWKLAITTRA